MRRVEMIKIGPTGEHLPADAAHHEAVLLPEQGLMFMRRPVNAHAQSQIALEQECQRATHAGFSDWRLPELDELEWIIDRHRYAPALDSAFFNVSSDHWLWTATDCAWSEKDAAGRSPSAWLVGAGYGGVYSSPRDDVGYALAVRRVGQ